MTSFVDEILKAIGHPNVKLLVRLAYALVFLGLPILKILNWISDLDKKTIEMKIKQAELKLREKEIEIKEEELKRLKNENP
jgi:hypothetical protein